MSSLQGKTAIVTGASQGIGRAIAVRLASQGAEIILAGRYPERLAAVQKSIASAAGANAGYLRVDLADPESINHFTSEIRDRLNELDILINCAGIYARGEMEASSAEDLDRLLDTNVRGLFVLTRGLLSSLIQARGDIVIVNSTIVDSDGEGVGLYAATQHARRGLANALRAEVNAKGVRVLSVYPGRTATPLQKDIHSLEKRDYHADLLLQPDDVAQAIVACLQLAQSAEVTDLKIRPRQKR